MVYNQFLQDRAEALKLMSHPKHGGAISGFVGGAVAVPGFQGRGLWKDVGKVIKKGWEKGKPILFSALRSLGNEFVKSASKSFTENKGSFKDALRGGVSSGLTSAVQSMPQELDKAIKKSMGGGALRQKNHSRLLARPVL